MAWGFLDWVRGRPFRDDPDRLALPENASDRELRAMALQLLNRDRRWDAYKLLNQQRDGARPVLESLLRLDKRFRDTRQIDSDQSTFDRVLEILFEWESRYALEEALKLVDSPDPRLRALAANHLVRTGKACFVPELVRLANDPDPEVREALGDGIGELFGFSVSFEYSRQSEPPLEAPLAIALYDSIRAWALRTDRGCGSDFARALLIADPERAITDLTAPETLTVDRCWLRSLISVMRNEGIAIPKERIVSLLCQVKAIYDREDFNVAEHGKSFTVTELLESLAILDCELAFKWIAVFRSHHQSEARYAAQYAREKLSPKFFSIAYKNLKELGSIDAMRTEHRVFYLIYILDSEVANGGWWQWLANSSGRYGYETVAAFHEVGAPDLARLLEQFLNDVGQDATSPQQEKRMAAIDRVMDAGLNFPDKSELWKEGHDLRALIYDYAERHGDAFAISDASS